MAEKPNATMMTMAQATVPTGLMRFSPKMPSSYMLRDVAADSPDSELR